MTRCFPGFRLLLGAVCCLAFAASPAAAAEAAGQPTVEEARKFIADAEARLFDLTVETGRMQWVQSNFITYDTEILAAKANEVLVNETVKLIKQAARFDKVQLPAELRRHLNLLKNGLTLPSPSDPQKAAELSRLAASLEGAYGAGKYCRPDGTCLDSEQLAQIMDKSRDPKELLDAWTGWHSVAVPMRQDFARLVELANEGARELGYQDTGALWRSKYDMPPDAFAAEVDRLWNQVKPLYDSLHCHVRAKLNEKYGSQLVPLAKPMPAHLLGNMWAQSWDNVYDLVAPPSADPGFDLTQRLLEKKVDAKGMAKYAENFFVSLGFAPLPPTFWERSLFTKPKDREVVCHASAWDIDYKEDLRIKMCIQITDEDFRVVHHEEGHNFYQRAYNKQPFLYQDSANDGVHEAVGDTIAMSITPEYLKQVGLIDKVPDPSKDLGILMRQALDKIAFLPFGLLVDTWRWQVFSGEIKPSEYNAAWWRLREKYQGVVPPVARSENDFDPGAKYHVAGNVPYTRYFLADILQYQLHRGLCAAGGIKGPLNRCSIYGNKEAGKRLSTMLEMGQSRPWPETLKIVTGEDRMDATAILDYFAPLQKWLDEQNKGRKCGW